MQICSVAKLQAALLGYGTANGSKAREVASGTINEQGDDVAERTYRRGPVETERQSRRRLA